jgi:MFS family permease
MTTQSEPIGRVAIPLRATIILVGTLGSIYMVSQFLRNSVAVIAPNLAQELHLSASEIGLLASAFFFAFAAAQIPLGIALDRYGPKICMLVCGGIAATGAVLFALAHSPSSLIAARILMGLGSSCYLMAPLALYARCYPPHQFASLTGIQMGLGSVGTLIATAPFALAVAAVGWRSTFIGVAVLMVLVTISVMLVVREDTGARRFEPRKESLAESVAGLRAAIRTPSVVPIFFLHLVTHASFVLVVGLWGGPYLTHIYGYDLTARQHAVCGGNCAGGGGVRLGALGSAVPLLQAARAAWRRGDLHNIGARGGVWRVAADLAARVVSVDWCVVGLYAGDDRARQVVIRAAPGRQGNDAAEHGHHGGRVSHPVDQRLHDRSVSGGERRVCARCLSVGVRSSGAGCGGGVSRVLAAGTRPLAGPARRAGLTDRIGCQPGCVEAVSVPPHPAKLHKR